MVQGGCMERSIAVGDFGPYQILFFFIICLPASLPSAFSAFNQPFVVGSPPHQCRLPPGRDDLKPQDTDPDVLKCFQYNQTQVDFYRSFTSSPIRGYRFGRRRSFFIILTSLVVFGTANAFVQ
ncbi:hypothetical protein OSTOST_11717, partial [Ostertagia ostertagi]